MATAAEERTWPDVLDEDADRFVVDRRLRRLRRLADRDRLTMLCIAAGFLVAALELALRVGTARHPAPWVYALFVVLYAAVSRVEFELGTGMAVPTQLVLVPMLFVLPLGTIALCVAVALLLRDPRVYRKRRLDAALLMLGSAWHTVGPVLVFALAFGVSDREPRWSAAGVYAAAFAAQVFFDLASGSARDWLGLGISPRSRFSFIATVYSIDAALAPIGLVVAFQAAKRPVAVLIVLPLVALLKAFSRERKARLDNAIELGQAYRGTALLLGDVVEADDAYTGEHSRDVVSLTLKVCDELGLPRRERRRAEFVALLHDVGKIRIPAEIINKPGPLDDDERAVIETHTLVGEEMLGRVGGLLGEIGRLVRSCHERWDGTGYPDGLSGEEIPLVARIVCATDAYSAMTTDRPYREARSHETALAELRRCAGTQFDPAVVGALERAVTGLAAAA